ncbi:putative casparian strip membrane protein [Helianthus debilis subsp. tardiflorus]
MENNHHTTTTTTRHHTTTNNRSMSDTDDEFHSPLHDIPTSPSKALVVSDNKYFTTTARSPTSNHQKPPQTVPLPPPVVVSAAYNRAAREEPVTGVTKMSPSGGEEGGRPVSPARRVKRDVVLDRAALGFRVLEVVLCLIAFSVMASDKTQGWSGDSFDRYKEYRYDDFVLHKFAIFGNLLLY